ncbi:MAG: 5'-3' exonuclease [Actinomycetales bacterium]|nr:5'-3' exonuclease [Actinomycetales bacterium]
MVKGLYFDSATLYYRAFFAVPDSVRAPDGTPSGAVRGFLDMVSTLITQFPADHIICAWDDDWRPDWRVALIPSYKTHRLEPDARISGSGDEEVPDDLSPQIDAIAQILDAIGLPRLGEEGFEADDILGSLVSQHDYPVDIVTGDKDLFQLVSDAAGSRVISISKGMRNLEIVDDSYLLEKFGVTGSQYADFATIRGDASDGLPGVKGIGIKGASELISTHNSLDELIAKVSETPESFSASQLRKLTEHLSELPNMAKVVRVRTDATVTRSLHPVTQIADLNSLDELAKQWGIARQVNSLLSALNLPKLDTVKA